MVYLGPSKGCTSCRRRRRKCDEGRPSCMRCLKANRTCGGYEDQSFTTFRHHETQSAQSTQASPQFVSEGRKCTLPKRVPIPGTDLLPADQIPPETSQKESNRLALRSFFYDYCVIPTNSNISRGYFSGLELMVNRLGTKSDLVKACHAVAFGTGGKTLNRPNLVEKAEIFHQELLTSFARAMQDPNSANAAEFKLIATLLGLYQISMASKANPGNHGAHAKGLAALMNVGQAPLDLLGTARPRLAVGVDRYSARKTSGVFSIPALTDGSDSLDELLLDLESLWMTFETSIDAQKLFVLKETAVALGRRFAEWQDSRVREFKPTGSGHVKQKQQGPEIGVGYWPGETHTYFDLYVAGVWNIFRSARLLLSVLIINLSHALNDDTTYASYLSVTNTVAEDIVASVPYHLTENLQLFVREQEANKGIANPGRPLGGLLLMHPLFVVSKVPFLPTGIREYARQCLAWIGEEFGIGQATLFAETSEIDREYLASGCTVIWSGFLM